MKKIISKSGLTTLELILTIAVLSICFGSAVISLSSFLGYSQLDDRTDTLIQQIRNAQSNSIMRVKDSQWGVYLDEPGDQFVFFKGASYASRDDSYDLIYDLPSPLSFQNISLNGGVSEIVFEKVTGETTGYGSFDIVRDENNKHTITVNSLGQIDTD